MRADIGIIAPRILAVVHDAMDRALAVVPSSVAIGTLLPVIAVGIAGDDIESSVDAEARGRVEPAILAHTAIFKDAVFEGRPFEDAGLCDIAVDEGAIPGR